MNHQCRTSLLDYHYHRIFFLGIPIDQRGQQSWMEVSGVLADSLLRSHHQFQHIGSHPMSKSTLASWLRFSIHWLDRQFLIIFSNLLFLLWPMMTYENAGKCQVMSFQSLSLPMSIRNFPASTSIHQPSTSARADLPPPPRRGKIVPCPPRETQTEMKQYSTLGIVSGCNSSFIVWLIDVSRMLVVWLIDVSSMLIVNTWYC